MPLMALIIRGPNKKLTSSLPFYNDFNMLVLGLEKLIGVPRFQSRLFSPPISFFYSKGSSNSSNKLGKENEVSQVQVPLPSSSPSSISSSDPTRISTHSTFLSSSAYQHPKFGLSSDPFMVPLRYPFPNLTPTTTYFLRYVSKQNDLVNNKSSSDIHSTLKDYPSSHINLGDIKKRMKDSYIEILLPFSSDITLREEYINFYGGMRVGKLMEDMDALAGSVAYKHCEVSTSYASPDWERKPLTIVTASIDRIDLLKPLNIDRDIKLSGMVLYTGKSSMEVLLRVESLSKQSNSKWELVAMAFFTMVARNPKTHTAEMIPKLELITEEEKLAFAAAEYRRLKKKEAAETSLYRSPPLYEESKLIHELFLSSMSLDPKVFNKNDQVGPEHVWMEDTILSSTQICHPQEKNIHQFIFGGFLMREAFELAFANASRFIRGRPYFVGVDETSFQRPVPIGSLLCLSSQIYYAEPTGTPPSCLVNVKAELLDVFTGTKTTTNTFSLTFEKRTGRIPNLLPKTYSEAMCYLEGKRRRSASLAKMEHISKISKWVKHILEE